MSSDATDTRPRRSPAARRAKRAGTSHARPWTRGLAAFALLLTACPSDVEDPERFLITPEQCEQVEQLIFAPRCGNAACHETSKPAAGLDLVSAGLASRVLAARSERCSNRPLVDPAGPGESFLVQKLGTGVRCGSRMPLARKPLSDEEAACVIQWVRTLADAPPPAVDGGGADGADGGGIDGGGSGLDAGAGGAP